MPEMPTVFRAWIRVQAAGRFWDGLLSGTLLSKRRLGRSVAFEAGTIDRHRLPAAIHTGFNPKRAKNDASDFLSQL